MLKILNTISTTAEDRIKNPFTGAFLASWIVFNWKPITFFIFSNKNIEEKITHILETYSEPLNILFFPLMSAAFFLFLVPWINLGNDKFIKKSKESRDKNLHVDKILKIQRETEEEEEKTKREIAIETVREQKGKNQQLDDLRKTIEILDNDLVSERTKNLELVEKNSEEFAKSSEQIKKLNEVSQNFQKKFAEESIKNNFLIENKENEIKNLVESLNRAENQFNLEKEAHNKTIAENGEMRENYRFIEMKLDDSTVIYENTKNEILQKENQLKQISNSYLLELDNLKEKKLNLEEKLKISDRELESRNFKIEILKDPRTKLLQINKYVILEIFRSNSRIVHFDYANMIELKNNQIQEISRNNQAIIIDDRTQLLLAIEKYEEFINSKSVN